MQPYPATLFETHMSAAVHHADAPCTSCGAHGTGHYCPACGEPAVHEGDLRLAHLTHEFLHEFTHIDGKIWRTLRNLLLAPGRLTKEYWEGRRGQWIRPLRLYLVISALQLILASNAAGPLGFRVWAVHTAKGDINYSIGTRPQAARGAAAGSPVTEEFNHRIQSFYLWTRYLSLGFFAAAALLLYRKRQPWYGAHLIFALHFYSFEYVISALWNRLLPDANPSVIIAVGFVYLLLALRYLYRQGWGLTFAKTWVLFIAVSLAEMLIIGGCVYANARLHPHA